MTKSKQELYEEAYSKMAVPTLDTLLEVLTEKKYDTKGNKDNNNDLPTKTCRGNILASKTNSFPSKSG